MPRVNISAVFEFVAKYPIQMLIAGGILLLILSSVFSATGGTTKTDALTSVGSQLATWGWIILVLGVIALGVYLYFRYGNSGGRR